MAELKHKEAQCIDCLAEAVPNMCKSEIIIMTEKIQEEKLIRCVYDMYGWINNPHNFSAAPAARE